MASDKFAPQYFYAPPPTFPPQFFLQLPAFFKTRCEILPELSSFYIRIGSCLRPFFVLSLPTIDPAITKTFQRL